MPISCDFRKQMRSYTFKLQAEDLVAEVGHTQQAVLDLVTKLSAERERLERIVPDAPEGYHWEFEIQQHEDLLKSEVWFRTVARLKENT